MAAGRLRSIRTSAVQSPRRPCTTRIQDCRRPLAYRYPELDGKPRDWWKAVYWLAKAGRQKEGGAMLALAEMFQSGVGLERNRAQAAQLLRREDGSATGVADSFTHGCCCTESE